jgi:8-oxo-dGTP pyrophosphatase MutT (NUDIX family)
MRRLWQIVQTVLGLIFRHPVTGTAVIPVLPDGRIVLIRRRDNGRWGLPGGMVDWGEDIPTTVRRELAEETGLDLVKIRRLVGVYSAASIEILACTRFVSWWQQRCRERCKFRIRLKLARLRLFCPHRCRRARSAMITTSTYRTIFKA